jgi:hypothetical protein
VAKNEYVELECATGRPWLGVKEATSGELGGIEELQNAMTEYTSPASVYC